jgi:hypothetical protein
MSTYTTAEVQKMETRLRHAAEEMKIMFPAFENPNAAPHVPLATQLRALLCDAEFPLLLKYAEHRGISLRVWGARPAGYTPPIGKSVTSFDALVAAPRAQPWSHEMSIEDFLKLPIGDTSTNWHTPTQLIKWVANKEGGAHFQLKNHSTLESVKSEFISTGTVSIEGDGLSVSLGNSDAAILQSAIIQIADWAVFQIEHVLLPQMTAP